MPPRRSRSAIAFLVALVVAAGRVVDAQTVQPAESAGTTDVAEARALFQTGLAAFEQGRWDEAREAFARAYVLYPRPLTLLDLAAAESQSGRLRAAQEDYRRLVRQAAQDPTGSEYGDAASRALLDLERRVPRAQFVLAGLLPGDVVRLDGHALDPDELSRDVALDPGPHTLLVERADVPVARTRFTLAQGQLARVALTVQPAPATHSRRLPVDTVRLSPATRRGSPWVAVGIVGGVVAVAVIATVVSVVAVASSPALHGSPPELVVP